jgi:arylsulfatase A-like enzyme
VTRARRSRRVAAAPILLGLAVLAAAGCRPPVRGNGKNVLLITLETTRADHLGAYGYGRATSPNLDRLAAEGALFERVSAVSPRTNPSLASLMTSLYPHQHGVRNLLLPLEPNLWTLAEALQDAGYETGAIQTHPRLVAASGMAQGFRHYDDGDLAVKLADESCRRAIDWIRERARGDRPWFMWLHLMDPHWTYDPPRPWRTTFGPDDPRPGRFYQALRERRAKLGPVIFRNEMPPDEIAAYVNFYDAEIRFTDEELGKLLRELDAAGLRESTIVIVTADHGESLGEHDYHFEHGDFGTEPEIHIPLIVRDPGRVEPATRVPWTVTNLDVAPTVIDLIGLERDPDFAGRSLVELMDDPARGEHRPCFGETGKRFHDENARREVEGVAGKWRWLRRGDLKLVHRPRTEGPAERVLYDLGEDPGETLDRSAERPGEAAELGVMLDAWIAEDQGEAREYHVTPELRETLRSLGYVD